MEKVSVILLNWNGIKYVEKCVESVLNQSYENIELIVVDNASTDGSIEILQNKFPAYKYILNSSNLGFAKGMNVGMRYCTGEYIMFLNLDVFLEPDYIKHAVARISFDNQIGSVGGMEYMWKDGVLTQNVHISCGPMYLRKRIQITGKPTIFDEQFCFGITGAFPLMRRKMLDDIYSVSGYYFDEDFETGWEDTDMRFRAFLRGWKSLYYPKIHSWHVLSASDEGKIKLTQKNRNYQVRIFRNRYYVILKNLPDEIMVWLKPYLFATELAIIPYYLILYPKTFLSLLKAKKEFNENKEIMLMKRQKIQDNILIDITDLKKMFIEY